MKKGIFSLAMLAVLISSGVILVSCGNERTLVGRWELHDDTNAPRGIVDGFEFISDGTGTMEGSRITWSAEDGRITIRNPPWGSQTVEYELSRSTLTLFHNRAANSFAVYRRVRQ